ncbi:MAG TPA: glycosyltransferase [Candidatus Thermoplasmatota archaeon]|nr:glycosyltransferase [Candidatus Thermoplasmatota archaeon]
MAQPKKLARALARQRHAAGRPAGGKGRAFWGFVAGAFCGYVVYWIGATLAAAEDLAQQAPETLPDTFLRPLHVFTAWEGVLMATGAILGMMVARYRWRIAGLLSYVSLVSLIAGYFAYSVTVSIPLVPPEERWLSYILLAAEGGGLSLIVVFSFYSLDASTRKRWARIAAQRPYDANLRPKVAFQVPVFNEPFEMVQQTILHLLHQDYPRSHFLVVVCDDSTDPQLAAQLAAFCAEVGAEYVRRPSRGGFKAGALNHATKLLPPDFELVAIIDADYWVEPDFLKATVGYFVDPSLSFVQTPQDYRNIEESFLTRRYKRAEAYFYHAIMPSRNEQNAIIFCGTMGILRRKALEEVGGFAEDQICEDAEISVRLACAGWESLYVDRTFGRGLMPAIFGSYKKQFHRWAFGNVRILFSRMGMILRSHMTKRQKFDFLVSNLHWFDGLFVTTIALVLLYLGLGPVLGYQAVTHHQRELSLLALVPIFLLFDGIVRLHLVLRRAGHIKLRETLMIQGMWFAIKFTNMWAALKCVLGFRTPFVRTPKDSGGRLGRLRSFFRALRITKVESLLGAALLFAAFMNLQVDLANPPAESAAYLLPAWLGLYALLFLCAPIYAYLSYRTLKPTGAPAPIPVRRPTHQAG